MHAFRTNLTPSVTESDFTVVWSRTGLSGNRRLLDTGGQAVAVEFESVGRNGNHSSLYSTGVKLPKGTVPGSYQLVIGEERLWLKALPKPEPRRHATLYPWTSALSADYVNWLLANGYDLNFASGAYAFDRPIVLPDAGCRIAGEGARFYRKANGVWGEHCFTGGQNVTFIGCEFQPLQYLYWSAEPRYGFAFAGCKFASGTFGWPLVDAVFLNCEWDRGGIEDGAPLGLYQNCRFRRNDAYHAFKVRGPCEGKLALIDCEWDDTDRGPIFHCNDGSVTDNLIVNPKFHRIQRDQNGNEMVSAEGGVGAMTGGYSFSRNLILGARVSGCDGNFGLMWDVPNHDNLYRDFVIEGGGGIWLSGVSDVHCTGNVYEEFELRDTDGIRFGWQEAGVDGAGNPNGRKHGLGIANNIIRNGGILGYRNSRMNQGRYDPAFYTRQAVIEYFASGEGNRIDNVVNQSGKPWHDWAAPGPVPFNQDQVRLPGQLAADQ